MASLKHITIAVRGKHRDTPRNEMVFLILCSKLKVLNKNARIKQEEDRVIETSKPLDYSDYNKFGNRSLRGKYKNGILKQGLKRKNIITLFN